MLKRGLRCGWRPLRLRSRCEEMHVCRRERQYRPLIVSQSLVSPFPLLTNYVQRRGVSIQQYIVRYTPEKEQKHKNDEQYKNRYIFTIIGLSLTWHRQSDTQGSIHQLLEWSFHFHAGRHETKGWRVLPSGSVLRWGSLKETPALSVI